MINSMSRFNWSEAQRKVWREHMNTCIFGRRLSLEVFRELGKALTIGQRVCLSMNVWSVLLSRRTRLIHIIQQKLIEMSMVHVLILNLHNSTCVLHFTPLSPNGLLFHGVLDRIGDFVSLWLYFLKTSLGIYSISKLFVFPWWKPYLRIHRRVRINDFRKKTYCRSVRKLWTWSISSAWSLRDDNVVVWRCI